VRLDPNFLQAWAQLSRTSSALFFQHTDSTAARKEVARSAAEAATRLNPTSAETLLANAYYRYHVERDYEGARALFEQIRREVPSSSLALEALARIARRQSRWTDCIRLFEEATKVNPRDAALFMDMSWTFSMIRDHAQTLRMIERAEAIRPNDPDILENKAFLFLSTGDLAAAQAEMDKIPPTAKKLDVRIIILTLQRRYREALQLLEQKLADPIAASPATAGLAREWQGYLRRLAGDAEGAKEAFLQAKPELERMAREQPENFNVSGALARVEALLGNKEAALREAERGVAALPASEDPVFGPIAEENLAGIEAVVGEHERAIGRIERLLRTPYGAFPLTVAKLRVEPIWDPLRAHPRFKAILDAPEPKTIYH
jgi:tetratricopeptide (TPR) repeat protein